MKEAGFSVGGPTRRSSARDSQIRYPARICVLRLTSFEIQPGLRFATIKDEMVLRQTPTGRYEIKATFLEDDRSVRTLTIQKYSSKSGPHDKQYFSFVGGEVVIRSGTVALVT